MAGFDVDVATYVAGQLGYKPDEIEWKEAPSGQRETLIQNGQVDFIAASYSITDARKQKVDFAGPYLITGQSLLVRADNNDITGADSLQNGKRLCSVSGSTPAQRIKDKYPGVQLQQYDTYSACVEALRNGAIDAVSTDEVILAGFAAQFPGAFKIIGKPFSKEPYGIGLRKGDSQLRTKINDAIVKMEKDGDWKAAFDKNLGPAGITAPPPPPPLDTGGTAGAGPARRHSRQVQEPDHPGVLDDHPAHVLRRDRGLDPRHIPCGDATFAGSDAADAGHRLRQRGA